MKPFLLYCLLFIGTNVLFAQYNDQSKQIYYKENSLKWGDFTYTDNLKGLTYFMTDLQKVDEGIYSKLLPEYEAMKERQKQARLVGGIGGGLGIVFIVHGILSGWSDEDSDRYQPNYATLAIGGVLTTGSLIFANVKLVKRHDILHFTNEFNQLAKGDKLRFGLAPSIRYSDGWEGGLRLSLQF